MKTVAWYSEAADHHYGASTYLDLKGNEIRVTEVADVADDWSPDRKTKVDTFHDQDEFDEELPLTHRWSDLVYLGEIGKMVRGNPVQDFFFEQDDREYDPFDEDDLVEA